MFNKEESFFDLTTLGDNFLMFKQQKEDSFDINLFSENNQSIDDDSIYPNEQIDIQETIDDTPIEDKKEDKKIIEKEEEPKAIEKEEEPKAIEKEVIANDDSDSIPCQNNELKFRTKKRKRNSTEKLPKGRKKAGNFLIDDLIPFHSSNRKDNKKSKIMILFRNFTIKLLNEYIQVEGNKKKKFRPISYSIKKNIGIADTYKLFKEKNVIDLINKDISEKITHYKHTNFQIYTSLKNRPTLFGMKIENFYTNFFLGNPETIRKSYNLPKKKGGCEFFKETIQRMRNELEIEEKMINSLEPDFLNLLEPYFQNDKEELIDKKEAKINFSQIIESKIGNVEIDKKRFESLINKIITIIYNYKAIMISNNIDVSNEYICNLYKEKFPNEKERQSAYIDFLKQEGKNFINDYEKKYYKKFINKTEK